MRVREAPLRVDRRFGLVEILVRTRDEEPEHALREGLFGASPLAPQAPGEREHAQLARHHPDARGGPLHAFQNLRDLLGFAPPGGLFAVDDQRGLGALLGRFAALRRKAPQLLLGFAPHVGVARRGCVHKVRAIVEGGGDGARGGEQRLLLALQQEPLHLAQVLVARPGQRKEHQRHQGELGAKAKRGKIKAEFQDWVSPPLLRRGAAAGGGVVGSERTTPAASQPPLLSKEGKSIVTLSTGTPSRTPYRSARTTDRPPRISCGCASRER